MFEQGPDWIWKWMPITISEWNKIERLFSALNFWLWRSFLDRNVYYLFIIRVCLRFYFQKYHVLHCQQHWLRLPQLRQQQQHRCHRPPFSIEKAKVCIYSLCIFANLCFVRWGNLHFNLINRRRCVSWNDLEFQAYSTVIELLSIATIIRWINWTPLGKHVAFPNCFTFCRIIGIVCNMRDFAFVNFRAAS